MRYRNFEELKKSILSESRRIRCAVVSAEDENTLEAVMKAYKEELIVPVLIGDRSIIRAYLNKLCFADYNGRIYDEPDHEAAVSLAIEMVLAGDVQCVMNGFVKTERFISSVLKPENRIRTGEIASMLTFREIPNYHKLLAFTDTGICPHPTLEQKKEIIKNAVSIMNAVGIDNPKVAVLAAIEEPNADMPESMDAAELKSMNKAGEITDCIIEGPISLDIALSREAAVIKGFDSTVAGDADLLLFPDLASANIATKIIAHITGAPAGVLVLGTRVPTIACSRAATVETKYLSITLAAANKTFDIDWR
jgi:phosphate butyryltransferase